MLFSASILIPANTPVTAPTRTVIGVHYGAVKQVWIRWRWGSGNLGGVRILRAEFQLWPLSAGQWFISSPHETVWSDDYTIAEEPTSFVVEAYNLDDTFDHTCWVAFSILPTPTVFTPTVAPSIW